MNPSAFLQNITKLYPLSQQDNFISKGNYQDASIACILRLVPPSWNSSGVISAHPSRFNTVDEVLEHMQSHDPHTEGDEVGSRAAPTGDGVGLEMLFIKRAMRPGDKWGGHVAWPGGFLNAGEEAGAAARREVAEELGVDLGEAATGGGKFVPLGAMDSTIFGAPNKSLHPHVYLLMEADEPSLSLEEKEVDAVMWVNVQHFLQRTCPSKLDTHTVLAEDMLPVDGYSKKLMLAMARLLGFDQWHFPCVRLPPRNVVAFTDKHSHDSDWVVWGITFNTIRRLLRHANGNQEYLSVVTPYRTENSIFNAFVRYFYQYYSKRYSKTCDSREEAANPDTDPNLHRKIFLSSLGGLAGAYSISALAGVGIYSLSTTLISNSFYYF
jgi:ADP-ribose pyrophosphatase YjhB (NUDIX family)